MKTLQMMTAGAALAFVVMLAMPGIVATHQPADKLAASGASTDVAAPGQTLDLLTGTLRTSSPEDLVLTLSLECSILTKVTTVGNDDSSALGRVEAWIEVDGAPVKVSGDDANGKVVFCDRAHRQTTSLFDDEDATITSYLSTRSAHSFNWVTLNLGSGIHTVVAKAKFTEEASSNAVAKAVVGKRTLVVEPTKLANDASI